MVASPNHHKKIRFSSLFKLQKSGGSHSARNIGKIDEHQEFKQEVELADRPNLNGGPTTPKPIEETWKALSRPKKYISLERVLVDAYEYHSLALLGTYFLWFVAFACFIFAQESASSATFKNSIVNGLESWDTGNPWEVFSLDELESIEDGYNYTIGYLENRINYTSYAVGSEQYSENVIWLSQFAQLSYSRLVIDFETNCRQNFHIRRPLGVPPMNRLPRCYRDLGNLPLNYTPPEQFQIDPDYWTFAEAFAAHRDPLYAVYRIPLTSISKSRMDASGTIDSLTEGPYYRAVAKYAGSLTLEMLSVNRLDRGSAIVKLWFRIGSPAGGQKLLQQIAVFTVRNRYTFFEIASAAIFLVGTICFGVEEFWHRQLYYWQTGATWGEYFSSKWNVWYCACYTANFIWISFWAGLLYQRENDYWLDHTQYDAVLQRAENYTQWLYCGDIIMIFIGVCMCRFMRVHRGLGVFYQMFITSFRSIMDFAVFVIYVLIVFGSAVFVFFKVSGGNSQFLTWTDSISLISRLGFGFLDYYGFSNKGLGLGRFTALATLVFWLAVIFLVVFVQNILLAIFNNAYNAERDNALEAEYSFIILVFKRTYFAFRWMLVYMLRQRFSTRVITPLAQHILGDEYNKDPEELYGMKKTARLRRSINRHTTLSFQNLNRAGSNTKRLIHDISLTASRTRLATSTTMPVPGPPPLPTPVPTADNAPAAIYGDPINYERLQQRYLMARWAVVQDRDLLYLARYFTNFKTRKLVAKGRMNWKLLEQLEVAKRNNLCDSYLAQIPNRDDMITEDELALLLAHVRKHRDMLSFRSWFMGVISRVAPFLKYKRAPYYTKDESPTRSAFTRASTLASTVADGEAGAHIKIEVRREATQNGISGPLLRRSTSLPNVDDKVEKLVEMVVGVYAYVHRLNRGRAPTEQKPEQAVLVAQIANLEQQMSSFQRSTEQYLQQLSETMMTLRQQLRSQSQVDRSYIAAGSSSKSSDMV